MCSASFSEKTTRSRDCHQHVTCLMLQKEKLLITAKKLTMTRTANYYLFDLTRESVSSKVSKNSGNYIGNKIKAQNSQHTKFSLDSHSSNGKRNYQELFSITMESLISLTNPIFLVK